MNRYDQHNYRGNSGRDYENRNRRDEHDEHNLSNYLSRYQDRGNYYGMRDNDYEYRNVSVHKGADYDRNTSGPAGGYGSSSNRGAYEGQSGGNRYGTYGNRQSDNHTSGPGGYQGSRGNQADHYRYGDPNPYMNYDRESGYDRTRGTGWRSESDDSRRGASDYSRQDNSYQQGGAGRRYSEFGRDERRNFGHSEELTYIHADRGEHSRRRSDNDYDRPQNRHDRDDNDATGMYSSNSAYQANQGKNRDRSLFDHTDDDYPSRSPRGYGQRSGPDWSAHSAIGSDYHRGADRG